MAGDLKDFVDSDLAHFFEDEAKVKVMFRDYLWIKKQHRHNLQILALLQHA